MCRRDVFNHKNVAINYRSLSGVVVVLSELHHNISRKVPNNDISSDKLLMALLLICFGMLYSSQAGASLKSILYPGCCILAKLSKLEGLLFQHVAASLVSIQHLHPVTWSTTIEWFQ